MSRRWLPFCLLTITFSLSGLSLAGYVLGMPDLYTWGETVGMAPNTAIAFLALATAGLCHLLDHQQPPYDHGRWDD